MRPKCKSQFDENRYKIIRLVGSGSYGRVFKIKSQARIYAMKEVQNCTLEFSMVHEAEIMQACDHPNLLKKLWCTLVPTVHQFRIFSDFAAFGDLVTLNEQRGLLTPWRAAMFFRQIMAGVSELHRNFISHRDIKPKNVLVFSMRHVKIGDFGLATQMDYEYCVIKAGTSAYQHPEIDEKEKVNGISLDLWGASMCYLYCLLGARPWETAVQTQLSYAAFQLGDLDSLVAMNENWDNVRSEFPYLRQILCHDHNRRKEPIEYNVECPFECD